jgi:hypothetical protein
MRFVLLLVALLFTACFTLALDPTDAALKAEAPAEGAELRFAWPTPSRVTVTQRALKKGKRSVVRYDTVLSARNGGGYELKLDKFQFVEMDGRDITKGPLPPELKTVTAMIADSIPPTLLISSEGQVEDVVGMEENVARVATLVPEEKGMRDRVLAMMRAMLAQPSLAKMMKQRAGDFWGVWVGAWVGTDLAAGEERAGTMTIQLPTGPVDSPMTMRHRGEDASFKGAVRLEMETVLKGEAFRKAMVSMLSQMSQSVGVRQGTAPDFDTMLKSASRVTTMEVVTDGATLRPYTARLAWVTRLKLDDQEREEREEREYSFAWP